VKKSKSLLLPRIEPQFLGRLDHSQVNVCGEVERNEQKKIKNMKKREEDMME
jgi:hypothetical protein